MKKVRRNLEFLMQNDYYQYLKKDLEKIGDRAILTNAQYKNLDADVKEFERILATLTDNIKNMKTDINEQSQLMEAIRITITGNSNQAELLKRLNTLSEMIENLNREVNNSFDIVLKQIGEQQRREISLLREKLEIEIRNSKDSFQNAIRQEISQVTRSIEDKELSEKRIAVLTERLFELNTNAMLSVGRFQQESMVKTLQEIMSKYEGGVNGVVKKVSDDVNGIQQEFAGLKKSLPLPRKK